MRNRPIGVFDSGLGGLTAVREISRKMPNESIIYFGDTGRVPYGSKSIETIRRYAMQDIAFLKSMNVKAIVAACGTVSSALDGFYVPDGPPFIGVLSPTCRAAVNTTQNGRIGVIGTTATIGSNAYKTQINSINRGIRVFQRACPLFVPLIESGCISKENNILRMAAQDCLTKFISLEIDVLILGCTHYPIIEGTISDIVGKNVSLIDSGKETAQYLYKLLMDMNLLTQRTVPGKQEFFVSDGIDNFSRIASIFLGRNIGPYIKKTDVTIY